MEETLAPPTVKLSVYAFDVGAGRPIFAMEGDGTLPAGYKLLGTTLKCRRDNGVKLAFKLKDRTGLDLEFSDDPFSASAGEDCPPTGPDAAAFGAPSVKGKTLTVTYTATGDVYSYVLRFVTADQANIEFDPIIINRAF